MSTKPGHYHENMTGLCVWVSSAWAKAGGRLRDAALGESGATVAEYALTIIFVLVTLTAAAGIAWRTVTRRPSFEVGP